VAKTYFFWDDLEDNIIEEYDEAGSTVADYTTEPDHFGNVISQRRDGQSRFFHYDALGSTLAVTDESQNVTDTRAYSAFGETTEQTGSTVFPFQYVGRQGYQTELALYWIYVRRRMLTPRLGRWLSRDPLGFQGSKWNLYVYAANRPTLLVDPSGETQYGNYCGMGGGPGLPMDALDLCCFLHDECYGYCGVAGPSGVFGFSFCARNCDRVFCACVTAAPCGVWPLGCEGWKCIIRTAFCYNALRPL
jgi:RHS repeat-associated protein